MVAAAVASLAYVPARDRLAESANRLVYGERQPPGRGPADVGQPPQPRHPDGRAAPAAGRVAAQGARPAPGRDLDGHRRPPRAGGVGAGPDRGAVARSTPRSARSSPAPASPATPGSRSGCPRCSRDGTGAQLRVAPASHSGELLGLLVVERPTDGDPFTEEDDRVLTELARQVGLALHNVQLDSALQESLDEPRAGQRRPPGLPGPHRGHRRRRAPQDRAQPPRRRPAAPRGAGREPAPGQGHRSARTPRAPSRCSTRSPTP